LRREGLFVFGYPVLGNGGDHFFGDECYRQTIECCIPYLEDIVVVARCRKIDRIREGCSRLSDVTATLGLELPDFGRGGFGGWEEALKFMVSTKLMRTLTGLVDQADFIYADGLSFEAYLVAKAAQRVNKKIMIEIRGEVLLNHRYMIARFGLVGIGYSWFANRAFEFVRKQAYSGLYINESLMNRYPIRGSCIAAITDVCISPALNFKPKVLESPASNYLYVGHLEKVKQVDLILRALERASEDLPDNWNLTIVGDGPEEVSLKSLARKLHIENRVHFVGRINWGDLLFKIYKRAHLLLVTSLTESGPRVIIEAMASGLPVLSTPVGLAPDVLDRRMIVNSLEVSVWAQAISTVTNDTAILNSMAWQNYYRSRDFEFNILYSRRRSFYAEAIQLVSQK
jgi:glycosyltransferase involved in cell wall biosynthesis